MMILILIIAAVVAGLIVVLAWRVDDRTTDRSVTKLPPPSPVAGDLPQEYEPPVVEPPAFIQGALGVFSPKMYKDLREHLTNGIETMFENKTPDDEPAYFPRQRKDVEPRILEKALGCLEDMDRIQVQQVRLQKLLGDPAVQMADLSKSITSDPVMTTKVLKMANSSYFGLPQKIDSIGHALMILGLQNVKNIIYREGLRSMFDASTTRDRAAVEKLWIHSNLVCTCAQHFSDLFEGLNRGALFTLGIVHDIGKLILMEMSRKDQKTQKTGGYPMDILVYEEDALFGINHAVIGGCVLERWNFSERMISSVLMHHAPSFSDPSQIGLSSLAQKYVLALFLSDQMARLFMDWNERDARTYPLRSSYVELVDKTKLTMKVTDGNFINQMLAAGMFAAGDHRSDYGDNNFR